jgi:lyso-ornithine lipid O-acyltransferase
MRLRRFRRAVALGIALGGCLVRFWWTRLRGPLSLEHRALWLQSAARSVLLSLGIHFHVEGQRPEFGLVVSNHLSYLDILIYAAAVPCCFVSKIEVRQWPYFGRAAHAGGTIFLNRSSHASAGAVATEIAARLAHRIPILLFPEGTSTDGSQVLRFRARLLHPATQAGAPVTAAAVRYLLQDGTEERELCWFGDAPFLSHLWKVLGVAGFAARIRFGEPHVYADPRHAAEETHTLVEGMRAETPLITLAKQA